MQLFSQFYCRSRTGDVTLGNVSCNLSHIGDLSKSRIKGALMNLLADKLHENCLVQHQAKTSYRNFAAVLPQSLREVELIPHATCLAVICLDGQ
jgi:hypothetical protein